jgi:hypothetical protein
MTKNVKRRYPPIVYLDMPPLMILRHIGRGFARFWNWLFDPAQFRNVDGRRRDERQTEDKQDR